MTDIVEWLRNSGSDEWCSGQLLKAADEIERLREALTEAAGHLQHAYIMGFTGRYKDAANAAKAALGENDD